MRSVLSPKTMARTHCLSNAADIRIHDREKENLSALSVDKFPPHTVSVLRNLKALNRETPEVIEVEVLRCALQRMSRAKEEAEAIIEQKERELQMVTTKFRRLEELLQSGEDHRKELVKGVGLTLEIVKNARWPWPAEVQCSAVLVGKGKKGSASRKLRKPHTPFLLWCKDKRAEVCDAHPTASTADLFAIMLEKWDTVSEEDKNHYKELYSAECEKYLLKVASQGKLRESDQVQTMSDEDNIKQKAMSLLGQYLSSKKIAHPMEAEPEAELETSFKNNVDVDDPLLNVQVPQDAQFCTQGELPEKHLGIPNKNPFAYLLFSMEQRKILPLNEPGMTHVQMNAITAKMWKEMSPEEKETWNETATALQKNGIGDNQIPLCIPAGLKLEKKWRS